MKPEHLQQLVDDKRACTEPPTPEEQALGFKGWYSSRYLPHFDAPGVRQYLTYRLADSLPEDRRAEWERFMANEDDLKRQRKLEAYLDLGHGACHLHNPRIAEVVQHNFWEHDGAKYRLLAWVVMPNHVHALIEVGQTPLGKILQSWKGYTSKKANKILRREGSFWEDDYFDRYIRDEAHLRRVVRYIENNPVRAHLVQSSSDWAWSSARFRGKEDSAAGTLTLPEADRLSHKSV